MSYQRDFAAAGRELDKAVRSTRVRRTCSSFWDSIGL